MSNTGTRYDGKSRIAVEIAQKEPAWTVIKSTTMQRIKGKVYVKLGERKRRIEPYQVVPGGCDVKVKIENLWR